MESLKFAGHCALVLFVVSVTLSGTEAQTPSSTTIFSTSTLGANDTTTLTSSSTLSTTRHASNTTQKSHGTVLSSTGSVLVISGCLAVFLRSVHLSS